MIGVFLVEKARHLFALFGGKMNDRKMLCLIVGFVALPIWQVLLARNLVISQPVIIRRCLFFCIFLLQIQ